MNAKETIDKYVAGFESGALSWNMSEIEDTKYVVEVLESFQKYLAFKKKDFDTPTCISFCTTLRNKLLLFRMGNGLHGKFEPIQDRIISELNIRIQLLTQENESLKDKNSSITQILEKQEIEIQSFKESKFKTNGVE